MYYGLRGFKIARQLNSGVNLYVVLPRYVFDHINKHKYKSWYLKYYVYYIILYVYVYLLSFHLIEFLLQIGGHDLIETSGKERWMEVEATNTHPKYSSATFSNDFAIMTLKDEVVFNQVQSILLLRFNYLSDFFIHALKT